MNVHRVREKLLAEWGQYLVGAAHKGALTGRPCPLSRVEGIAGPRAGALEIYAGLEADRLLRALAKSEAALLRQFIPWSFLGEPSVYMAARSVRVEAGWPDELSDKAIRLDDMGRFPRGGGRWIAGRNERGLTVVAGLNDRTPHFLLAGATGSGKSVALRSAVVQLARDPANRLVLIDGKYGESLSLVAHVPGVVGPVAMDGPAARAALGWVAGEMRRRYEQGGHEGRVIVAFDEIQEFVGDGVIVGLMKKIAAQGRAAGVHALLATQHPTVEAFGDPAVRRNLTGKLALRVSDADASRVAVGGALPRADYLLGSGDAYAVGPGAVHRLQMAYVDGREVEQAGRSEWLLEEWPDLDGEGVGQELPELAKQTGWSYTGGELAAALISAAEREGRPAMVRRLVEAGLGRPGAERAIRLLRLGQECCERLASAGYRLSRESS